MWQTESRALLSKLVLKYPPEVDASVLQRILKGHWKSYLLEKPSLELCKSLVMLRDYNISGRVNLMEIPLLLHMLQFWRVSCKIGFYGGGTGGGEGREYPLQTTKTVIPTSRKLYVCTATIPPPVAKGGGKSRIFAPFKQKYANSAEEGGLRVQKPLKPPPKKGIFLSPSQSLAPGPPICSTGKKDWKT